jgi:hypothetical protein
MWICPVCGEEVDDGFEVCWSCGSSVEGEEDPTFDPNRDGIIREEEYQARQEAMRDQNFVTLATFWNAAEAHVARSRLDAAGVPSFVADELATTATWGLLNVSGGVKLMVAEQHADRAREILGKHLSRPAPSVQNEEEE